MGSNRLTISSRNILTFLVVAYALVFAPLVDAGLRNYMALIAASVGAAMIVLLNLRVGTQVFFAVALFGMMATTPADVSLGNGILSVFLTALYSAGYFAIVGVFARLADKKRFAENIMRKIIYAFAIVSVVQMLASLVGLPVPNVIASKGMWSYNSLAMEPSQLGRVVGITLLAYLIVVRPDTRAESFREMFRKHRGVLLASFVAMMLSGSALAAIALPVALVLAHSLRWAAAIAFVTLVASPVILLIDYEPLRRSVNLLSSLGSLDIATLHEADASGAARVIPLLLYFQKASLLDLSFWFGYGNQGLIDFFQGRLPGQGDKISAGFLPGFAVVYGIIATGIFVWLFILRLMNKATIPLIVFWMAFISTSSWNTQLLWYALATIAIVFAVDREKLHARRTATA
ncbi:MAG: hypothetical protein KDK28_13965 [Maritimibacter sp.]|nr:hypothetical protein [Maritimibacter sp.]